MSQGPIVHYRIRPDGCWEWQGALDKGYGRASLDGQSVSAHRLMYAQHVGPIPDGHQIDHVCRNAACVNPDHLEAVTQACRTCARAYMREYQRERRARVRAQRQQRRSEVEGLLREGATA